VGFAGGIKEPLGNFSPPHLPLPTLTSGAFFSEPQRANISLGLLRIVDPFGFLKSLD